MNKKFTLIEVVVTIVILGILLSIVLIQTNDFKKKSIATAVASNIKILQTASDNYFLDNEVYPTNHSSLTLEKPQLIDIKLLVEEGYLKKNLDLTKIKSQYYWVDVFGRVWGSTDNNKDRLIFVQGSESKKAFLNVTEKVESYVIYKATGYNHLVSSNLNLYADSQIDKQAFKEISRVDTSVATNKVDTISIPNDKSVYLISMVDDYGLESAPVGTFNPQGFKPLLNQEGDFFYEIEDKELMYWYDFIYNIKTPGKSTVSFQFQVKDKKGEYKDYVDDFYSLEPSTGIRVKISMRGDEEGNKPSVYSLMVKFRYKNELLEPTPNFLNPKYDDGVGFCPPNTSIKSTLLGNKGDGAIDGKGTLVYSMRIDQNLMSTGFFFPKPQLDAKYRVRNVNYYIAQEDGYIDWTNFSELKLNDCLLVEYEIEILESYIEVKKNIVCGSTNYLSGITASGKTKYAVYQYKLYDGESILSVEMKQPVGFNIVNTIMEVSKEAEPFVPISSLDDLRTAECLNVIYEYEYSEITIDGPPITVVNPPNPPSSCLNCDVEEEEEKEKPTGPSGPSTVDPPKVKPCGNCDFPDPPKIKLCKEDCPTTCKNCVPSGPFCISISCGQSVTNYCEENPEKCGKTIICELNCGTSPPTSVKKEEDEEWVTVDAVKFYAYTTDGQSANWTKVTTTDVIPTNTRIVYKYSKTDGAYWSKEYDSFSSIGSSVGVLATAYLQLKKTVVDKPEQALPRVTSIKFESSNGTKTVNYKKDAPIVIITPKKSNNVNSKSFSTKSKITWDYYAYDSHHKVVDIEWAGDKRESYPAGRYSVKARVQNEAGVWSDWTEYILNVYEEKPIAVITSSIDQIHVGSFVTWSYLGSVDPDGDGIVKVQWEGDQKSIYQEGSYSIRLRVQDGDGNWSDWTEKKFNVDYNWITIAGSKRVSFSYNFNEPVKITKQEILSIVPENTRLKYNYGFDKGQSISFTNKNEQIEMTEYASKINATIEKQNIENFNFATEPETYEIKVHYENTQGVKKSVVIYGNRDALTKTFSNYGVNSSQYVIPLDGEYTLDINGASGGNGGFYRESYYVSTVGYSGKVGELGDYTFLKLKLKQGDILTIYQGTKGVEGTFGARYLSATFEEGYSGGGGGGAASLVYLNGELLSVAAGGKGGNGYYKDTDSKYLGSGGKGGTSIDSSNNGIAGSRWTGGLGGGKTIISNSGTILESKQGTSALTNSNGKIALTILLK